MGATRSRRGAAILAKPPSAGEEEPSFSGGAPNYNPAKYIFSEGNVQRTLSDLVRYAALAGRRYRAQIADAPVLRAVDFFILLHGALVVLQLAYSYIFRVYPLQSVACGLFCSVAFAVVGVVVRFQLTQPAQFDYIPLPRIARHAALCFIVILFCVANFML